MRQKFLGLLSVVFLLAMFLFPQTAYAQLTGTKTIPGDYATIAAAITDLNTQGVGTGGVTFNVAAGYTETLTSETAGTITATGTLTDQIIFQKSGVGANPLITAYAWTVASAYDGMIKIAGGDYITFDGIDLQENAANTTIYTDWGYALVKASSTAPFNGCQFVTIKNCVITLNKANTNSVGIYTGNHIATATTSLTITDPADANSNNKFFSNTITNCYSAISISGFAASSPYTLYDQNNEVGVGGANTITNFGGGTVSARAIYSIYQNGLKVNNNNISSTVNGSTTTVYGIFLSTGTSSSADVAGNTISLSLTTGTFTSTIYGINNAMGSTAASNTININNNIFQNCDFSGFSTGNFYAILNSGTAATVNINNNTVNNITMAGTGTSTYMIEMGSPVTGNMNGNNITTITRTGASGTTYGLKITSPTNLTANGNTVDGINYTNTASTGTVYGFYGLSSAVNVTVTNNIFRNFSTPTTGALYGIREFGVSGTKIIQNNQVYNFSTYTGGAGGESMYGIYCSTGNIDISNNVVYALNSTGTTGGTGGTLVGIYISGGTTNNVYKNKVYDISTNSTNPALYGIQIGGGTTNTVYNNLVGDLRTPAANAAIPLAGLYISGGTTTNAYYNTVYLNASSTGALFGSSALYASSTPTVNLIDNIFVNNSTPVGATGFSTAYRRTTTTLTTYANTSNNNLFYAGTPGVNNLIFYDATNSDQTIAEFKTRVAPRDVNSFTENPTFLSTTGSNANFLHISTGVATQIESGGIPVAGITDDFDGNLRNATTPDVGADEGNFPPLDLSAPSISYTALGPTNSTSARTLVVNVVDPSGVPTTAPGWPYLYWRINAGSWNASTPTGVAGSDYTFSFGAGVVVGDLVEYYVVAQDGATIPNVGAFPSAGAGGFTANPPAASTPPTTPSSYLIVDAPLSGPYTVGSALFNSLTGRNITFERRVQTVMKEVWVETPVTEKQNSLTQSSDKPAGRYEMREVEEISFIPMENGKPYTGDLYVKKATNPEINFPAGTEGVYATITAAVNDLNLRGVGGATTFLLTDATYTTETLPIVVNIISASLPTAVNTVTIRPNTSVTASISGASASAQVFRIRNSYVTIDGSNSGGTDRSLTIENTSTTTPQVVSFNSSGTTPLVGGGIKNCTLINGVNTSSALVITDLAGTAGYFNNITIQNNSVQKAYIGIYCNAFVAAGNGSGLLIAGNDLSTSGANSVRYVGIYVQGADGAVVRNNTIANFDGATSEDDRGIWFATGTTNSTIDANLIHTLKYTGTGGYGCYGAAISTGVTNANILIKNNMIYNLSGDGWSYTSVLGDNTHGLYIFGTQTGVKVYNNSIHLYGNTLNQSSAASFGLTLGTGSTADLKNNIIVNNLGLLGATGYGSVGVYLQTANTQLEASNYNDLYVNPTGTGVKLVGQIAAVGYADLATWQAASLQDANSISADPKFVANTDLHIDPLFDIVSNNGTPLAAVTTDFDGQTRSLTTPDMGADEYTYTPPSVDDPTDVAAIPGALNINVQFTPNLANNNVVIVWNSTGTFTAPSGTPPAVGQPFAGGTVLYVGLTSPANHTGLTLGSTYYYKVFSNSGINYSPGVTANATTSVVNPSGVTATTVSGTQINLAWIKNANNDNVMVVTNSVNTFGVPVNGTAYAVNDPVTGGGTVVYNGSASGFNHTSLTSGTTYYYKVFSAEVATNYYSSGVTTNATTLFSLPYFQNFNAGTTLPSGWTGTMSVIANHGTAGSNGLSRNLYSSVTSAIGRAPFVGPAAANTQLEYDYRIVDWSGYPTTPTVYGVGDSINVQVSTDNVNWTTVQSINSTNHVTSLAFVNKQVNLGAYSGNAIYIRFNCVWANGDYYVDIDNVYLGSPSVANPGSFSASAFSTTQIDLAFTTNPSNNNVVIVWNNTGTFTGPSGTPPAVGQPFAGGTLLSNGITSPVNHTGLTASTTYYYRAFSYNGTDYSTGLDANATTVCGLSPLPFAETFDGTLFPPTCWTRINAGTGNDWQRSTSAPYAGLGNMRYTYNSTNAANAWMITPGFALESGKKYYVSFYQNTSGSYPEKLKVTVGTAPNVAGQTTTIWDNAGGTSLTNAAYELRIAEYIAPATGTYYFGFNCYSDADEWYLNVDEITIIEQPDVDLAFTSFTQTSGLPTPRFGQNFSDYNVSMNKQTLVNGKKYNLELNPSSVGVSSSNANNTVIVPGVTPSLTDLLANVDLQALITNLGANAASYNLNWDVSGVSQTPYSGPTVNSGSNHTANLTFVPSDRGTFVTSGTITVVNDEIPGNNAKQFRMRVYPDTYSRILYDRGDNLVDTYIGWGSATTQFKAGVRFTNATESKLGGVDFICRTETVTSGDIIIQVRAAGTDTLAPGAVLYTQIYNGDAYLAAGEGGDYIHFPFGNDAPTIAAGSDYWITIKMPIGILYPGGAHATGFVPGRSFFEGSTDTTLWSPLVITPDEFAWIMRSVNLPTGPQTFQLSVNVTDGWNMTSAPGLHPTNQNVSTWWPNRNPLADVYKWNGSYSAVATTDPGEGYWMLHTGAQTYNTGDEWPAGGIEIVAHDPIAIINGWNMIGGYDQSIPVGSLSTTPPGLIVPGTIYGWNGAYYNPTNLEPGYGYWVLTTGAGVINVPAVIDGSGTIAKQDDKSTWGKITVTDATGKNFTLYTIDGEVNLDHYQMPPLPPTGAFDARFSSHRVAEDLKSGEQTIELRGMNYPVTLKIDNVNIKLQDETGKLVSARLKPGEEIKISNSQVSKLRISENIIPDVYALEQNYPNPFNPSTVIQFSLPEDVENVRITIYNALGQRVTELVNTKLQAGQYEYRWDARDVASGLYIYELRTEKFSSVKKMMLLK
ncbi:MAG: hypothetical protein IPM56_13930 [Ignavibacteriales bacterium]|nr:MAG: hypothetical protein IPM56_13930 [Ignavibacteriales bacterium]